MVQDARKSLAAPDAPAAESTGFQPMFSNIHQKICADDKAKAEAQTEISEATQSRGPRRITMTMGSGRGPRRMSFKPRDTQRGVTLADMAQDARKSLAAP